MVNIKRQLEKILGFEVLATENYLFGDYSSNAALKIKKKAGGAKSTRIISEGIVAGLNKQAAIRDIVERIEPAGPGFINFFLKKDILIDNLIQIVSGGENYGKSQIFSGSKIVFEYAHPNTHKAFHIGHLRNITTGEALSRLYEAIGTTVVRANYQGDVGLHIAKAIYGIKIVGFSDPVGIRERAQYLGKVYAKGASAYEVDEKAKEEIHLINIKIYDKSDPQIDELYQKTRQWSLDYFEEIYKRVYTKFDRYYFESEVYESGKRIALEALAKGILKESDGAIIFPGSEHGLHDRVFISGRGVPTYEAKDLGLAKLQFLEYHPDKLIHIVGPEQAGYFQVIFKALEFILPETKGKEVHIPYGWVKLKEGKMSSRTGNVVLGEDVLDMAKDRIIQSYKTESKTAETIAVGAVKYSFLKTGLNQDIAFDINESISLEGNSGPYLQYTVARCNSVVHKAGIKDDILATAGKDFSLSEPELLVLRKLVHFPEIVENAAYEYSPNLLCNYLYSLAQSYNSFYNSEKIIGSQNEVLRVSISKGVARVLKNGLKLLGIESPERM